jgi:hypothetical protein
MSNVRMVLVMGGKRERTKKATMGKMTERANFSPPPAADTRHPSHSLNAKEEIINTRPILIVKKMYA